MEFLKNFKKLFAFIIIIIIAALIRFALMEKIPGGLTADRIDDLYYTLEQYDKAPPLREILAETPKRYSQKKTTQSGFDTILAIITYKILGVSLINIKKAYIIISLLSIIFIGVMYAELFGYKIGLIASYFTAISLMHIAFSAEGSAYISGGFYAAVGLYLIAKLMKTRNYIWALITGFWSGISLYFYMSSLVIVLFLLFLGIYIFLYNYNLLIQYKKPASYFIGGFLSSFLPYAYYMLSNNMLGGNINVVLMRIIKYPPYIRQFY